MDGEVDTFPTADTSPVRDTLSRLMPVTGHLGLSWDPPGGDFWAEAALSVADLDHRGGFDGGSLSLQQGI